MHVFAQENSSEKEKVDRWALRFGIASDFRIGNFDGNMLSIEMIASERSSWRLDANFAALVKSREERSTKNNGQYTKVTSTYVSFVEYLDVNVSYVYRYLTVDDMAMYIGCGSFFGVDAIEMGWNYQMGAIGYLGADWRFHKHFSVFAEYAGTIGYHFIVLDNTATENVSLGHDRITTEIEHVRFGLRVIF